MSKGCSAVVQLKAFIHDPKTQCNSRMGIRVEFVQRRRLAEHVCCDAPASATSSAQIVCMPQSEACKIIENGNW